MTKRGGVMPKVMVRATNPEERLRGVSWQRVAVVLRAFIKGLGRQDLGKQEVTLGRWKGSGEQKQVRIGEESSVGSKTGVVKEDDSDEGGTKRGEMALHERSSSVRQLCWKEEGVLDWSVTLLESSCVCVSLGTD